MADHKLHYDLDLKVTSESEQRLEEMLGKWQNRASNSLGPILKNAAKPFGRGEIPSKTPQIPSSGQWEQVGNRRNTNLETLLNRGGRGEEGPGGIGGLPDSGNTLAFLAEEGAISKGIIEIAKEIGNSLAIPLKMIASPMKLFTDSLVGLQQILGPIDLAFDLVSKSIEGLFGYLRKIPIVNELVGPLLDAAEAIPQLFKQILDTFTAFGAKNNPALLKSITQAVDDFQAGIGRSFLPVMVIMRDLIRGLGEAFADIIPNFQEVRDIVAPLRQDIMGFVHSLKQLSQEYGQDIRELIGEGIKLLAVAFRDLLPILLMAAKFIGMFAREVNGLLRLLGLHIPDMPNTGPRSFVGAAARPATFNTFEEYESKGQLGAYGGGTGEDKIPSMLEPISNNLDSIASSVLFLLPALFIPNVMKAIWDAAAALGNQAADKTDKAVNDLLNLENIRRGVQFGFGGLPGADIINQLWANRNH